MRPQRQVLIVRIRQTLTALGLRGLPQRRWQDHCGGVCQHHSPAIHPGHGLDNRAG
jgi:hypothetical protein